MIRSHFKVYLFKAAELIWGWAMPCSTESTRVASPSVSGLCTASTGTIVSQRDDDVNNCSILLLTLMNSLANWSRPQAQGHCYISCREWHRKLHLYNKNWAQGMSRTDTCRSHGASAEDAGQDGNLLSIVIRIEPWTTYAVSISTPFLAAKSSSLLVLREV